MICSCARTRQGSQLGQAGHDARRLLDGAERRPIAARHHQRGDNRRRPELRLEQLGDARPLERAGLLLLKPGRRLREERPDHDERQRGDDARHGRVAPRFVSAQHRRQVRAVGDHQVVRARGRDAAQRSQRLCVADNRLSLLRVREELRQPGDGGHEFHTDADERTAAPEEQLLDRGGIAGCQRAEGVEEDAPGEHSPPAEEIREVAAEQSENAASDGRYELDVADPLVDQRAVAGHAQELDQPRTHDQGQHQQRVRIVKKADGRDPDDEPLDEGQTGSRGVGMNGSHEG